MTSDDLQAMERALSSAHAYILARQAANGSWVDWQLPPGESRPWTTAFVGYKLASLEKRAEAGIARSTRRAAQWLLCNRFSDEGWGYNSLVGSDADSTAHAILLLAECGEPVPEASYLHLRKFQRSDGGFSTYLPQNGPSSWTVSHPDVTPVALLALLTKYSCDEGFIQSGLDFTLRQRTPTGLWNSFWWESFLYGTEANLSLLSVFGRTQEIIKTRESLLQFSTEKSFELALQLSALLSWGGTITDARIGPVIEQYSRRLVTKQQENGSWDSESILRVTNRDCYEPWRHPESGALFSDPNRLFTCVTVAAALSKVLSAVQPSEDLRRNSNLWRLASMARER